MQDFYNDINGSFDWPVSNVRPDHLVRSALARKLDEFAALELSAEDEGFLRLAQLVAAPHSRADLDSQPLQSRPGADWGGGLVS